MGAKDPGTADLSFGEQGAYSNPSCLRIARARVSFISACRGTGTVRVRGQKFHHLKTDHAVNPKPGSGSVVRRCTSTYEPSAMKAEAGFAVSGSRNFSP